MVKLKFKFNWESKGSRIVDRYKTPKYRYVGIKRIRRSYIIINDDVKTIRNKSD